MLHQRIELRLAFDAVRSGAIGHVVVDAHRERIGLLKDHAHALAQMVHVDLSIDIFAVHADVALDAAALHQIVHPVQAAQKRGLAAAARADQRRDLILRNIQIDILERVEAAVMQVHAAHFKCIGGIHRFILFLSP